MFRPTKSLHKTRISHRIELPANFDNRVIELEGNTLIVSSVIYLNGN
jgi:hypothetical protein